jgi:hypothetical protein
MKRSFSTAGRLLVSLLACTALTLAAPPNRQKANSSRPKGHSAQSTDDFRWAVTSFRHHPEHGHQLRTETSDVYLNRLHGDPASEHEYVHSLHPTHRTEYLKEIERKLDRAHKVKAVNNAEYQVFKNNVQVQVKGLNAVKQGHSVQIANTVHHPVETPLKEVAADYYDEKTAKMVLHPVQGVQPTAHGTIVHAMNLLGAPPKYAHEERRNVELLSINRLPVASAGPSVAVNAAVKVEPHTEGNGRGVSGGRVAGKGIDLTTLPEPAQTSWQVTSNRLVRKGNEPPYFTETVEQYRKRVKEEEDSAQGKDRVIRPYKWTPHPIIHDPRFHGEFLSRHIPQLKAKGYPQERIDTVHSNEKEISKAWRFINEEKGAVYFPDSVHHHNKMQPSEVVSLREDSKIGHMKITQYPEGTPGGKNKLQFVPSRHESHQLQSAQASGSKRARQDKDQDDGRGKAADKKQRNA